MTAHHGGAAEMCQPLAESTPIQELNSLVKRVQSGDTTAVPAIRSVLDANPNIWQLVGDLAGTSTFNTASSILFVIRKARNVSAPCLPR